MGWVGPGLAGVDGGGPDRDQADIHQLRDELLESYGEDEEARTRFLREDWPDYERVLPSTVPAYSRRLVQDDGPLWIAQWDGISWLPRLPGHPGNRWDVFDPSGRHLRQVLIPPSMQLLDASDDWVLVAVRNSLGVDTLAVYAIN